MARELIERIALVVCTVVVCAMLACAAGVPVSKADARVAQDTAATQTTVQAAPDSVVHVGDRLPTPDTSASP